MKKQLNALMASAFRRVSHSIPKFIVYFLIIPSITLPQFAWAATGEPLPEGVRVASAIPSGYRTFAPMADHEKALPPGYAPNPLFAVAHGRVGAPVHHPAGADKEPRPTTSSRLCPTARSGAGAARLWNGFLVSIGLRQATPFTSPATLPETLPEEDAKADLAGALSGATGAPVTPGKRRVKLNIAEGDGASESKTGSGNPSEVLARASVYGEGKAGDGRMAFTRVSGIPVGDGEISSTTGSTGSNGDSPESDHGGGISAIPGLVNPMRDLRAVVVEGATSPSHNRIGPAGDAWSDQDDELTDPGRTTTMPLARADGVAGAASGIEMVAANGAIGHAAVVVNPLSAVRGGSAAAVAGGGEDRDPTRRLPGAIEDDMELTPPMQKLNAFAEELFSHKATRLQTWKNIVTFVLTGALCYSIYGMIGYFNDNLIKVPNSTIAIHLQAEGVDEAVIIRKWQNLDIILLAPYFMHRMRALADHVFRHFNSRAIRIQKPSIILAAELGIGYLFTLAYAGLKAAVFANNTYQANEPWSNFKDYSQTVPPFLGIFMGINFYLIVANVMEEKVFPKFVAQYSGPVITQTRQAFLDKITQVARRIYSMKEGEIRKFWTDFNDASSRNVGIEQLKMLLSLNPATNIPSASAAPAITVRTLVSRFSTRRLPSTTAPNISRPAVKPVTWKGIGRRIGQVIFGATALAAATGSGYLGTVKTREGIIDLDRRIKTGQADSTFFEQIVDSRGIRFEQNALATIPGLLETSMRGWPVYNGLSNYTGDFSGNNGYPYPNAVYNLTDACSTCLATVKITQENGGDIAVFDPGKCPWAPVLPGGIQLRYTIDRFNDLWYVQPLCEGLYGYIASQYADIIPHLSTPGYTMPHNRYFYESYVRSSGVPQLADPRNGTFYTPLEEMNNFAWTAGIGVGALNLALGTFFFMQVYTHIKNSFSKDPEMPIPGKNNRIFNAIEMPLAAIQSVFWSAPNFFLIWGALHKQPENFRILAGTAAVVTDSAVWFKTFDEAFTATAGLIQQGCRNIDWKIRKALGKSGDAKSELSANVMKERLLRKLGALRTAVGIADPEVIKILDQLAHPTARVLA